MAKSSAALGIAEAGSMAVLGRLGLPSAGMLRLRLVLFALACMGFALLTGSAYLLPSAWEAQRDIADRAQSAARSVAQSVDREVAAAEALLSGLSVSPSLTAHDLPTFHSQAANAAALANFGIILLAPDYHDLTGNLISTNRPFDSMPSNLPRESIDALRGIVERIVATRQPAVTESAYAPVLRVQTVVVGIPVIRGDKVIYVLAAVLVGVGDAATRNQSTLPANWFMGVVDQKGKFLPSRRSGDRARSMPVIDPASLKGMANEDGSFPAMADDGTPVRVSYTRSHSTGLTAIAAVPSSALDEPITRMRLLLGAAALLALVFAVAFALAAAPNLSRPMRRRIAETEATFGAVADTLPSILFIGHGNGKCDFVSERFYAFTGLPSDSATGLGWTDALHPEDHRRIQAMVATPEQADALREVQFRLRAREGSYRWFASRWRATRDPKSGQIRWIGIATDVDDLKQAEARLRLLSLQIMKAQDAERRRIAREIHDTTVQNLAAAAIEIDQVRAGIIPVGATATQALVDARQLIDQSLQELRTLSYFFHPPMLDELGFGSAIRGYARGLEKRAGLCVAVDAPEHMPRYTDEIEGALFRVAQEALANVHRHSGSKEARIRIACDPKQITLEICDRGRGIPPAHLDGAAEAPLGVGIPGMRLRLQQIGGCLNIESSAGGTIVRAIVPAAARGLGEGTESKSAA